MRRIEYADKSWNPFSGCLNWSNGVCEIGTDCWAYNRARMLAHNPKVKGYQMPDFFKPTFHPEKLDIPLKRKKPTVWATCFMGDIGYCDGYDFQQILNVIEQCKQHTFLLLTKLPERKFGWDFPDNVWFGVTINTQKEIKRMDNLRLIHCKHKWISFEPPKERIMFDGNWLDGIDGIAIGGQTGKHPFQPKKEWVESLGVDARIDFCRIVIKDNLENVPKRFKGLKEWP